jgi:cytochrome c peroxidase
MSTICEPGGDDPVARPRASPPSHACPEPQPSSAAAAIRPSARGLCGQFQDPTLWGVKDTAPYFHDNGAKTLRDAVAHYQRFFNFTEAQDPVGSETLGGFITLTDADVDDIVAYLKLL